LSVIGSYREMDGGDAAYWWGTALEQIFTHLLQNWLQSACSIKA